MKEDQRVMNCSIIIICYVQNYKLKKENRRRRGKSLIDIEI